MSILSLLNTTVELHRKHPAKDSSGGQQEKWALVAGTEFTPALIQPVRGQAARFFGQRQVVLTHHIYLAADCGLVRGDRLYHTSTGRYFLVHGYEDMAGQHQLWRVDVALET